MGTLIDWSDFLRVELRVGSIVAAAHNPGARKPAYVRTIDLGPLGTKVCSAQITDCYDAAALQVAKYFASATSHRRMSPESPRRYW
jgi:tRNA-binding EMAP/Myf-like protein